MAAECRAVCPQQQKPWKVWSFPNNQKILTMLEIRILLVFALKAWNFSCILLYLFLIPDLLLSYPWALEYTLAFNWKKLFCVQIINNLNNSFVSQGATFSSSVVSTLCFLIIMKKWNLVIFHYLTQISYNSFDESNLIFALYFKLFNPKTWLN